ncbi:MAG: FAD-dependent oxidoreductase, partial [Candidatus Hydrothermarchaeaceae archaeon]
GAGAAGLNVAGFMNRAGFKVLLIEREEGRIGGDCLNFGCVPSKALIHVSKMVHGRKSAGVFGLEVGGKVDLGKVMQYVESKREVIREHENAGYLRGIGMDVVIGVAKFASRNSVMVGEETYTAKKIVIATGGRPRELKVKGIESVEWYNNETIFGLKKLPERMVVIGGGPIGIEIGQAFNRLGTEVSVINRGDIFLPKENYEISKILLSRLEKEGMEFYFNSSPKEFLSDKRLLIEDKDGTTELSFDVVFVGIGRVLNIEGLDLKKAGIEVDRHKIRVDKYLRTTNKNVLLCGDVAGSYQFTHATELHARVIINNLFSPLKKKLSYDKFSWVTYTDPEIATFGLTESELKKRNIRYDRLALDFSEDDRAIVDDYTSAKSILYVSKGKVVGGTMAAPNAGEIFQELALAMESGMDIKNIFNKTYPYPTASRVNQRIVALHYSKRLTGLVKKIMRVLYH